MSRVLRRLRLCLALPIVLAVLSVPSQSQEPEHLTIYGRTTVAAPERTDAGDWAGTWFYVNKRRKMALWMRIEEGTPEFKLRVQEKGQNVTTDWEGQSSYDDGGRSGEFSTTVDQRDENTISGSWVWTLGKPEHGWKTTADFTMYRTGHGRQLVMRIEKWHREYWGSRSPADMDTKFQVWTFQKASRRQALWGELPF
jgi:hypothetical protein